MASFPLGGEPPDRFFYALGRVSFEAENTSSNLDILLQVLTQLHDISILSALIGGESLNTKIEKCKRVLEVSNVFPTKSTGELRQILSSLSGLAKKRNHYIHATWDYYNEKSGTARATRTQRGESNDIVVNIGQIEELVDSFVEKNDELLDIIGFPFLEAYHGHDHPESGSSSLPVKS